jgi:ribonucleotide reductase alpha subunit
MTIRDKATGIIIDPARDELLTPLASKLLKDHYLRSNEDPQQGYARASKAWSGGDDALAQRLYDAVSRNWFMFASPVLSNAPLPGETVRGMPISCFLSYTPDTLEGLMDHSTETRWLSVLGGGVGGHWRNVRSVSNKAPGPIPFLHTVNADMEAYSQGSTRRGSYAAYLDVSHPDILEFISVRKVGGDDSRKCFSKGFHHGVNVTDAFMDAVVADDVWELIDPHNKAVRGSMKARDLWQELLETRYRTGEPYLYFIDAARRAMPETQKYLGLELHGSNLCVAPETQILTDKGYFTISSLKDQTVNVWNGKEWSETCVRQTGIDQKLIKVMLSDGSYIECTLYHKFYIQSGYLSKKSRMAALKGTSAKVTEVRAGDLKINDTLYTLDMPVVESGHTIPYAYASGFMSADGTHDQYGRQKIWLYEGKRHLAGHLHAPFSVWKQNDGGASRDSISYPVEYLLPKFTVPFDGDVKSRLEWLAGLSDGDGSISRNGNNESLQIGSVNLLFLNEVRLLLNTLGVQSNISLAREAGSFPLPDGHGALKNYDCQSVYRLLISSGDLQRLVALGFSTKRLKIETRKVQRDARQLRTVVSVEDNGRYDDTYCFNESKRHMGVFNGVLTGNCIEITLPTNEERTAVCCLSSLNAETYDDWKDTTLVQDLIEMLDNVVTYFITNAPSTLSKAAFSASQERSLGLGMMGFHAYLQKKNVAFESEEARKINKEMFRHVKHWAVVASSDLASTRGEAPDMIGTGRRNCNLLAVAPNANSALLSATSPSIEPAAANAFVVETRAGTWPVKNRYLERVLEDRGFNTDEVWKDIVLNKGSVQHLNFLTDHEKDVFKTAIELNQMWIVRHAADRQPFICQSQSLNLFFPARASKKEFHDVHMAAWKLGLKSLYYCRSMALNRADSVSNKVKRDALKDGSYEQAEESDCASCQG